MDSFPRTSRAKVCLAQIAATKSNPPGRSGLIADREGRADVVDGIYVTNLQPKSRHLPPVTNPEQFDRERFQLWSQNSGRWSWKFHPTRVNPTTSERRPRLAH